MAKGTRNSGLRMTLAAFLIAYRGDHFRGGYPDV